MARRESSSLVYSVHDIPLEGVDLKADVNFKDLYKPEEKELLQHEDLLENFQQSVRVEGTLMKIASKVDIRGTFEAPYQRSCDRCNRDCNRVLKGSFDTFLMAKDQFSAHDKPGGKVIHSKEGYKPDSRHRSKTKARVLTEAEGEHEDERFGSFDGQTVDLRALLREYIVLQIPMRLLCDESCEGLCLECKERIEEHRCACAKGPTPVIPEGSELKEPEEGPLSQALKKKRALFFGE